MLRTRLETDAFCAGCGYNLHAQEVWQDERLKISVCRCPECGRHHPAGIGVSATSNWLKRLATFALLTWVLIVVAITVIWSFGLGGMQMGYVGLFTYQQTVAADGTPLQWDYNTAGQGYVNTKTHKTEHGAMHNVLVFDPAQATFSVAPADRAGWKVATLFCTGGTLLGLVGGALFATAVWHWRRRRYAWLCVLPLIAFGFVFLSLQLDPDYEVVRRWASTRAAMVMGYEMVGILIGVRVGRPIARTIARLIIPPKPRMLLAFLWFADGKAMPVDVARASRT